MAAQEIGVEQRGNYGGNFTPTFPISSTGAAFSDLRFLSVRPDRKPADRESLRELVRALKEQLRAPELVAACWRWAMRNRHASLRRPAGRKRRASPCHASPLARTTLGDAKFGRLKTEGALLRDDQIERVAFGLHDNKRAFASPSLPPPRSGSLSSGDTSKLDHRRCLPVVHVALEREVRFAEVDEGDYRIYAGALEAPALDGYVAAVVISRVRGVRPAPQEAFRDMSMADGRQWVSAHEALEFALFTARKMIRRRAKQLAC